MINILSGIAEGLTKWTVWFNPDYIWFLRDQGHMTDDFVAALRTFLSPASAASASGSNAGAGTLVLGDIATSPASLALLIDNNAYSRISVFPTWNELTKYPTFDGVSLSSRIEFVKCTYFVLIVTLYTVAERMLFLAANLAIDGLRPLFPPKEFPGLVMMCDRLLSIIRHNSNKVIAAFPEIADAPNVDDYFGSLTNQAAKDLIMFAYVHQYDVIAHALSHIHEVYNVIDSHVPIRFISEKIIESGYVWGDGALQNILDSRTYLPYDLDTGDTGPADDYVIEQITRKVLVIIKEQTHASSIYKWSKNGLLARVDATRSNSASSSSAAPEISVHDTIDPDLYNDDALSALLDLMENNEKAIMAALEVALPPRTSSSERTTDYINRLNAEDTLQDTLAVHILNKFAIRENWFDEFRADPPEEIPEEEEEDEHSSGGGAHRKNKRAPLRAPRKKGVVGRKTPQKRSVT
jgi:hypothetical protein